MENPFFIVFYRFHSAGRDTSLYPSFADGTNIHHEIKHMQSETYGRYTEIVTHRLYNTHTEYRHVKILVW